MPRLARGPLLALRASALLACSAAVVTAVIVAAPLPGLHPRPGARPALRDAGAVHPTTIVVHTPTGDEPAATVIPPDAAASAPTWPEVLLNPEAHLHTGWELSLGRPESREVLFSFDDGPNPGTTDRLLPMLARAHIHAMFFVCGWRMEADEPLRSRTRALLQQELAEGHTIGNHTVHHRVLSQISAADVAYEIDHNEDLIEEVIHQRPRLFRPPYGAYNNTVRDHLVANHYELWMWSIDPHDYEHVNEATAVEGAVELLLGNHAGGTVLLHDTHAWSVTAFGRILRWIENENRDRVAAGKAPYAIQEPMDYLAHARDRLPLIEAAQEAERAARRHRRRHHDDADEPTSDDESAGASGEGAPEAH